MRPLIIGAEEKQKLHDLTEFAKAHVLSHADLVEAIATGKRIGDDPGYKCFIPVGFCVVFSHEEQPMGLTRHMSMSVDIPHRLPHPESVKLVMELLGFEKSIEECIVKKSQIHEADGTAALGRYCIEVLEKIDNPKQLII